MVVMVVTRKDYEDLGDNEQRVTQGLGVPPGPSACWITIETQFNTRVKHMT